MSRHKTVSRSPESAYPLADILFKCTDAVGASSSFSLINIEHLKAFVTLSETLSFRLAAERLKISQPTLSTRLQQFESFAAVNFFDRTSRHVVLTQAGEEFLPTAIQLINDFDLYLSSIESFAHQRRGLVRIAALYSVATALLPEAVKIFHEKHPEIRIELRDDNSAEVTRRVLRGEVDFGFANRQSDQPDLHYTPLFRDRMVVAFRSDHPLAELDEIPISELAKYTFIGFGRYTGPGQFLGDQQDVPENVRFPVVTVWNTPTLEALLMEGIGVSVLPNLAIQKWHRMGLASRPLEGENSYRDVQLVTMRGRTISPSANLFREELLVHLRQFASDKKLFMPMEKKSRA